MYSRKSVLESEKIQEKERLIIYVVLDPIDRSGNQT